MMTPAEAHIWSCRRSRVVVVRVERHQGFYRLTAELDCGHEATQDFKIQVVWMEMLGPRGAGRAREKAERAATAMRAAGFAPCLACGPAA